MRAGISRGSEAFTGGRIKGLDAIAQKSMQERCKHARPCGCVQGVHKGTRAFGPSSILALRGPLERSDLSSVQLFYVLPAQNVPSF